MKNYLLFLILFLGGCALTFKIQRHFSQGDQVFIQREDGCCNHDRFGEITEQPSTRDTLGHMIYHVRDRNGWVMPYSEYVLDSLNNWY